MCRPPKLLPLPDVGPLASPTLWATFWRVELPLEEQSLTTTSHPGPHCSCAVTTSTTACGRGYNAWATMQVTA